MDNNFKRALILDNFENPFHKGLLNDATYIKGYKKSKSCIDNFNVELKVDGNIIKDIRYDGEACAIATSSMSISANKLIDKTIKDALNIINNYENMIDEKEYDKELLEELNAYEDIYKQPSRKKCATLGIDIIKELLEEIGDNQ